MELHILITQVSFNTAHETDLHAFYVHFPSLERQNRLSVWNYGARSDVIELDSLSSCYFSVPSDTLLEKGTSYKSIADEGMLCFSSVEFDVDILLQAWLLHRDRAQSSQRAQR